MPPQRQSAAALEPLLARAVGEPDVAAEGALAIERVIDSANSEVEEIMAQAEQDVSRLAQEADRRAMPAAAEKRRELAAMRHELTDRASALAIRFEAILDLLEAAEDELARRSGEAGAGQTGNGPARSLRMTLRERKRIRFLHEDGAGAQGAPAAQAQEAPAELAANDEQPRAQVAVAPPAQLQAKRRRRWWRRWLREAA